MDAVPTIDGAWKVSRTVIASLSDRLRSAQRTFDETGGLHAAGLFDLDGTLLRAAEDVGRHNAVDKVIGGEVLEGRVPMDERILFVSGRTSFEIVQKAVRRRHSARGVRVRAVEPGDRRRARAGRHAGRVRPRRHVQHLLGAGSRADVIAFRVSAVG